MGRVCLVLLRNHQTVFQSGCTILHSHQPMNQSSCSSASSPAFGDVSVLDFDHSGRYAVVSHYFNLHFPDDIWCGSSFVYTCYGVIAAKFFHLCFNLFCWILRLLCIIGITAQIMSFVMIFLTIWLLFFILLIVSFCRLNEIQLIPFKDHASVFYVKSVF